MGSGSGGLITSVILRSSSFPIAALGIALFSVSANIRSPLPDMKNTCCAFLSLASSWADTRNGTSPWNGNRGRFWSCLVASSGAFASLSPPRLPPSHAQTRFEWLIKPHCSHGVRTGSQRRTLAPSDDVPHARERCANFGLAATQRATHAQTQQTTPRAHASYSS